MNKTIMERAKEAISKPPERKEHVEPEHVIYSFSKNTQARLVFTTKTNEVHSAYVLRYGAYTVDVMDADGQQRLLYKSALVSVEHPDIPKLEKPKPQPLRADAANSPGSVRLLVKDILALPLSNDAKIAHIEKLIQQKERLIVETGAGKQEKKP